MSNGAGGYTPLVQILDEIRRASDAGATVAALAMVYVAVDTMAWLACPIGRQSQTRGDFIGWVDKYLTAEATSEYRYEGIDLYAARCAVLHTYGSEAALHGGPTPPRKFGYTDNGPHKKDDVQRFVLISVAVLIRDFSEAMLKFMRETSTDPELKRRVDSRVGSLLFTRLLH
jgi:hypothetical protein